MKQVLDAYVKPEREIIDYNTRLVVTRFLSSFLMHDFGLDSFFATTIKKQIQKTNIVRCWSILVIVFRKIIFVFL